MTSRHEVLACLETLLGAFKQLVETRALDDVGCRCRVFLDYDADASVWSVVVALPRRVTTRGDLEASFWSRAFVAEAIVDVAEEVAGVLYQEFVEDVTS